MYDNKEKLPRNSIGIGKETPNLKAEEKRKKSS